MLVLAVVGLVGQPEPGLHQLDDVAAGVVAVVADVPLDQTRGAVPLQPAEQLQQLSDRGDAADVGEVGGERLRVELLGTVGVHERGVEVADLALVHAGPFAGLGRLLEQGAHVGLCLVAQLVERAVRRAVVGDLGGGEPPGVDVSEQVVLGTYLVGQLVGRDP